MRTRYSSISPLRAVGAGLVAGALGSLAQNLFFSATRKLAPEEPEGVFTPPEPAQAHETKTQTVARRVAEGLARRSIDQPKKELGGQLVHVAFGAGWGALYGLAFGPSRRLRGPLGALAFSLVVWAVGDNVVLPVFRLSAPPQAYPGKTHAYALAAHLAYGGAVWGAFELLRRASPSTVLAVAGALWTTRKLPAPLRRPARAALVKVRRSDVRERAAQVAEAIRGDLTR